MYAPIGEASQSAEGAKALDRWTYRTGTLGSRAARGSARSPRQVVLLASLMVLNLLSQAGNAQSGLRPSAFDRALVIEPLPPISSVQLVNHQEPIISANAPEFVPPPSPYNEPGLLPPPPETPFTPLEPFAIEQEPLLQYWMDAPLGFTGPSGIITRDPQTDSHFVPLEDRWRMGFPAWDRYGRGHPWVDDYPYIEGHWWDPYNQN